MLASVCVQPTCKHTYKHMPAIRVVFKSSAQWLLPCRSCCLVCSPVRVFFVPPGCETPEQVKQLHPTFDKGDFFYNGYTVSILSPIPDNLRDRRVAHVSACWGATCSAVAGNHQHSVCALDPAPTETVAAVTVTRLKPDPAVPAQKCRQPHHVVQGFHTRMCVYVVAVPSAPAEAGLPHV